MDYKEFVKYTKNPETYSSYEVDNLKVLTERELDEYQKEVEIDSGNLSDWDHVRAIITFKKQINDLKELHAFYEKDRERGYEILANVRDILLPLVNPENNPCGDMGTCTVSKPKCVECLAKRIVGQVKGEV